MIVLTEQERRLLDIIQPVAAGLGLEIVRLRIQGSRRPSVQIMAERAGGAPTDVEDCARLSRALSPVLDAADPIQDAYVLEVSTPGIDRPLTRPGDFARWSGHAVRVELSQPLDGRRRFTGIIRGEDEMGARIGLDDETELVAQLHEMSRASLILTDALIEAAQSSGGLPPQPGDEAFDGLEVDEAENDDTYQTDDQTGEVQ
jgi:ribosome maturation factor RimP